MRSPNWTSSIVPDDHDHTVYLVADDFKSGRVWCETDYQDTGLETVIQDLLTGQYNNPSRVVAFNTAEHWSQDVLSIDVARELRRRCDLQGRDTPFFLQDFTDHYEGRYRDVQLPPALAPRLTDVPARTRRTGA